MSPKYKLSEIKRLSGTGGLSGFVKERVVTDYESIVEAESDRGLRIWGGVTDYEFIVVAESDRGLRIWGQRINDMSLPQFRVENNKSIC